MLAASLRGRLQPVALRVARSGTHVCTSGSRLLNTCLPPRAPVVPALMPVRSHLLAAATSSGAFASCATVSCEQLSPPLDALDIKTLISKRLATEPPVLGDTVLGDTGESKDPLEPTSVDAEPASAEPEPAAATPTPAADEPLPATALQLIWTFVDKWLVLAGGLLTLASVVVAVMVPTRSAALLKAAKDGALSARAVLLVLLLVNVQAGLKVLGSYCLLLAGQKLKRKLRSLVYASVLGQDLGWVAASRPAALVAQIVQDTDEVARAVSGSLGMGISSAAGVVGSLVQLAWISPHLTAFVLAIAPPIALMASMASRHDRWLRRKATESSTAATVSAGEAFTKLPTIQAYAQEAREAARYGEMLAAESELQKNHLVFHKIWTSALQLLTNASTAVALALAGVLAGRGMVDPSMLLSFSQLSMSLSHGVGQFLFLAGDVAKVGDAAERLRAVVEREPAIPAGGASLDKASPFLRGEVALKDVSFSYPSRSADAEPNAPPVLNGLSLVLPAGKVTALVGPSGGGKTTVAHLLARFHDASPGGGAVTLDGLDLRLIAPTWLRSQVVGLVTQEPVLLPGTVAENIAYGRPSATPAEVEAAARAANAHTFIGELPQGYDTELREGGGLSVGQRQRIAIARALLKDPKVLVMDEPTSALDSESEKVVQQALDRLAAGRTTLVVAHRLSTIRNADSIAVLRSGRVTEQGTHDELLALGGEYAAMVKASERYERATAWDNDSRSGTGGVK